MYVVGCGMWDGNWEYTQRLVTDQFELSNALTSNRMLPHCGFEGLSTLGLKQQRIESPPPRARAARHREVPVLCLERRWLRMQHPMMKPKRFFKILAPLPTQPWYQDHKGEGMHFPG